MRVGVLIQYARVHSKYALPLISPSRIDWDEIFIFRIHPPPLVKFPPGCSFSCFVLLWETLSCLPYHHQFRWCPKIAFSSTLVVQPLIWVARMMGFGGSTKYPRYMHCHSPGLLSLASSLSRRVGIEGWGKNKGKSVSRIQGIVVPKSSLVIILFHLAYYHGSDHAESE